MMDAPPAIRRFRDLFERGEGDVFELLNENVELRPPTYGKSWIGRNLVARLLVFAASSFGGLRYTQVWVDAEASFVLRFEGELDGKPFSGVDVVSLDVSGGISRIEIFARPPAAMLALRDRMTAHVRGDPIAASLMGLL